MGKLRWKNELRRFEKMSPVDKAVWLAALQSTVTLVGRETYIVGSLEISDTSRLRQINEFMHRISEYQLALLTSPADMENSAHQFSGLIEEERRKLNISGEFLFELINSKLK
jgi:hypothetical protein